jgi:hypothetical protein
MKKYTHATTAFITRFSTDFALHKLKTHACYLTTVSFYRGFVTLLTAARTDGAGLAGPGVVGGFAGGALGVVVSVLANIWSGVIVGVVVGALVGAWSGRHRGVVVESLIGGLVGSFVGVLLGVFLGIPWEAY